MINVIMWHGWINTPHTTHIPRWNPNPHKHRIENWENKCGKVRRGVEDVLREWLLVCTPPKKKKTKQKKSPVDAIPEIVIQNGDA